MTSQIGPNRTTRPYVLAPVMINEPSRAVALLSAPLVAGALLAAAPTPAAAATTVPLTDCAGTDNGRPVVSSVTVGTRAADVRQQAVRVPVSVVVDDTGGPGPASGVGSVFAAIAPDGGLGRSARLLPTGDGRTFSGSVLLVPGVRAGTWTLGVTAEDAAGLRRSLDGDDVRALGIDPTVEVASSPDRRSPVVRSFSVDRRHVDTRAEEERVRVTVRAADATAGIGKVRVIAFRTGVGTASTVLHRLSGSPSTGTWRGHLVVPRWVGTGQWRLKVQVKDRVGRWTTLTPRDLAGRGLPSWIGVTSRTDTRRPVVSDVQVAPDTVDARTTDAFVRVSAHVRDSGSGVRRVGTVASLGDDGDAFPKALHRVSGTRHDGRWSGRVRVTRCQLAYYRPMSGTRRLPFELWATDRAGRYRDHRAQPGTTVTAQFRDNDTPFASTALLLSGQIEVTTQEPIVGNGSWDPLVADHATGAEVAGIWTCFDASGAPVDCAADPLSRALFTPAVPLSPSATYDVTLNREHTLHLVDLAGNPLLGTQTATRVQR